MNRQLECLENRITNICDRMKNIRAQGSVAPPQTWIQKYYVSKANGKKYYYYRLLEATNRRSCTGSIQGKVKLYLGNKHSSKYHTYKAAIGRRNELKSLKKRYQQLMGLYKKAISKLVSQGKTSEVSQRAADFKFLKEREEIDQAIESSSNNLIPAVVELRATEEQLWYWLKIIADKLGVTITGVPKNLNSG